jgi:glucan 1,3-beta-glucosidase
LGGWLVLERWITPSLFEDIEATDEYGFSRQAESTTLEKLKKHRNEFITKEDFEWIKEQGLDAVRIPVGAWIFGDEPPYSGAIDHLDDAFRWAEETGLKVVICLHGAPGSQNGKRHSGQEGEVLWQTDQLHIAKTLRVIDRLANRYKSSPSLYGIELLNEPAKRIPRRILRNYYQRAYQFIRAACGEAVMVIFHDGFQPANAKHFFKGKQYTNVMVDSHLYQAFQAEHKTMTVYEHVRWAVVDWRIQLERSAHPVLVGEWSLALDSASLKSLNDAQVVQAYKAYGAAQLLTFSNAAGWFYWTYKTESGQAWNFRLCVERGLLSL